MIPPDPVRAVVLGVVTETLRASGASGLLLHRTGTPEHNLVLEWAHAAGISVRVPGETDSADRSGTAIDLPAPPIEPDLLLTDPANKLVLLLEGPVPGARLLPLGDLWPDGVATRIGGATTPSAFQGTPAEVATLVKALQAALEEGRGLGALSQRLPADMARHVGAALLRVAPQFRPPVVPKLTGWTPGIDPGL